MIGHHLVMAAGDPPPGKSGWTIGIAPLDLNGKPSQYLSLSNAAVATSGDLFQFVEIAGKRYSHIVDPRTGWPAEATPSVTIIGPETTGADALATAVSVLGAREGMDLVAGQNGYEAMIVVGRPESFQKIESRGFSRYVHE